jgi:hypothetical protein
MQPEAVVRFREYDIATLNVIRSGAANQDAAARADGGLHAAASDLQP